MKNLGFIPKLSLLVVGLVASTAIVVILGFNNPIQVDASCPHPSFSTYCEHNVCHAEHTYDNKWIYYCEATKVCDYCGYTYITSAHHTEKITYPDGRTAYLCVYTTP